MQRIYTALSCLMLLFLLLMGLISTFDKDATFSESEKRPLKTKPKFTLSGFLDGNYFISFREYYADTFPGREDLMGSNTSLNKFYYFSGLSSDEDVSLIINFDSNAAQHGQALKNPDETQATQGADATQPSEDDFVPQITEPAAQTEQLGNVILVGDRAMDVPVANGDHIRAYAAAVNAISNLLGPDVQTISMPVPNAAAFYASREHRTGARDQKAMFDLVRDTVNDDVLFVDAYTVLAKHTDEYIYFRTDHHWTHQGAYYAYTALCKAVGFTPEPQSKFETGQLENFVGSLYTYSASYPQAAVLKNNPDTVYYWKPFANCETYYYNDTNLNNGVLMGTICRVREDESNKYLVFMGGDRNVTVVTTDTEGPCIMVIKESYGNALISWLTSHYSKIILIDPREYFSDNQDIDLKAFAEAQGVDQCLIINYPMMLNSQNYISLLERLAK